jgi:hypothetical protein
MLSSYLSMILMGGSISQLFPMAMPMVMECVNLKNPIHVIFLILGGILFMYKDTWIQWIQEKYSLAHTKKTDEVYSYTVCANVNGFMEVKTDPYYPSVMNFIRHLLDTEENIPPYEYSIVTHTNNFEVCTIHFYNEQNVWKITDRISIRFLNMEKRSDTSVKEDQVFSYKIKIESPISTKTIDNFLEDAQSFLQNKTKSLCIYRTAINSYGSTYLKEHPFDTTKSFDNLFFSDKDKLLKRVDLFMNRQDIYQRIGMPYTLGILLHGPPGTGKTSCIKALARYMDRNPIIIPCSRISTYSDLMAFLFNDHLANQEIPMEKRLYILEEIDCGHWAKIIRKRTPEILTEPEDEDSKLPIVSKVEPTLTLGQLLEVMDGVFEMPGRVIVFTSNHPEIIDPALLRPGRIDLNIQMDYLRRSDVRKYYEHWFETQMSEEIASNIVDHMFSQATLGELFASQDMDHIHDVLTGKK